MSTDAVLTLVVLLAATAALIFEWLPAGIVALSAPLVLVVTGVLEPDKLWAGFAHPAVIAIAAMFVVSAGISRTGALGFLGEELSNTVAARGQRYILLLMMFSVALISAFTNNTTVVLVGLPVVLSMCEKIGHPPSRYLIPLSFASIFGGMTTLIGTSTNVVVAEVGRKVVKETYGADLFNPGMWDFTPMGGVFVVAGVLYMAFLGVRLLKDRVALSMTLSRGVPSQYVTEAEIVPGSSLIGRTLGEVARKYEIRVMQLVRDDVIEIPKTDTPLQVGDALILRGAPNQIVQLGETGASLLAGAESEDVRTRGIDVTLAEVIVPPGSRWIDRRVSEIGLRSRYGVSVIALQRHGHHVRQKVGDFRVESADMLLVQGTVESLRNLRASENLILVEGVEGEVQTRTKAPVALAILLGFVLLVSTGFLHLATGAVAAAAAMVLFRCITPQQAYNSFDWNVLLLLAGFLGMGTAMEQVGLAAKAAEGLMAVLSDAPFAVVVIALYSLTAFLSDVLTNAAVAALMTPIVVRAAKLMEVAPEPFLMTVAFAASAAFLTPVGYQTNLLVYGPGGYRFQDFVRVGLPLRVLFILLAGILIPIFYPP